MTLWIVNATLALLTLSWLLRSLFVKLEKSTTKHDYHSLLASRLTEIERERSVGLIATEHHEQVKQETKEFYNACTDAPLSGKTLLTPARTAVVIVLFIAVASGFYFQHSDGHRVLALEKQAREAIGMLTSSAQTLREHLQATPDDAKARLQLAEIYYMVGDYTNSIEQYRWAEKLDALRESEQWLNYADTMLRSGELQQADTAIKALDKLLVSEPNNERALFTLAFLHFERQEYAPSIKLWQRLLQLLPASESALDTHLREFIEQAQARLAQENRGETKNSGNIRVTVTLSSNLNSKTSPSDTVFIYARAIDGPPMPIAIKRLTVSELPAEVTLGDKDAMMANMNLGQFNQVEIVARVSKLGQALPEKGDLIGIISPVTVGEAAMVEIKEIVD